MTPQERQLVEDLFDRLSKLENAARDPDAAFRRMQRHVGAYSTLVKSIAQAEGPKSRNGRKPAARRKR